MKLARLPGRIWAMERGRLEQLLAQLAEVDVAINAAAASTLKAWAAGQDEPDYEMAGGTAVINIRGVILKEVPWYMGMMGVEATATGRVQASLSAALADEAVRDVLLLVDSPGGTISGVQELADAVYDAKFAKPVRAHIEDLGASAAYWIASQAGQVTANQTAEVGSIGVYSVWDDWSRLYKNAGVDTHVVASGEHKGAGVIGAAITERQLAAEQETVDKLAQMFMEAVGRGRDVDAAYVDDLADGRVWLAPDAVHLGLIDAVGPSPLRRDGAGGSIGGQRAETLGHSDEERCDMADDEKGVLTMTEDEFAEKAKDYVIGLTAEELASMCPATTKELRADAITRAVESEHARAKALAEAYGDDPGAMDAFLALKQPEEAYRELAQKRAERIRELEARQPADKADKGLDMAFVPSDGASAKGADERQPEAVAVWQSRVKELMEERGMKKADAMAWIAEHEPETRKAYLLHFNPDAAEL